MIVVIIGVNFGCVLVILIPSRADVFYYLQRIVRHKQYVVTSVGTCHTIPLVALQDMHLQEKVVILN